MTGIILTPTCRQSQMLYAKFIETDDNSMIVDWENILPESDNDHSINVNFEGDSEDILNHTDAAHGHTQSMTGTAEIYYVDPLIEQFFQELREECDRLDTDCFFEHIGRQLIRPAIIELNQMLRNMQWYSPRTRINPYSKKISKIKVKGLGRNNGRVSAQYFSLKSTRKQNTSSVR